MGMLSTMIRRTEQRSHPSNPTAEILRAFGVNVTESKIFVDEETALRFTAVWAAVRVISETIASLPRGVFERLPGGGKRPAPEHALDPILRWRPNDEMTSMTFFETGQSSVLRWGNSHSEIERTGRNDVVALHPLNPRRVLQRRDPATGRIVYDVGPPELLLGDVSSSNRLKTLDSDNMLHVLGLSLNGLVGLSPISVAAKEGVGIGLAAEEFGARFFGNDATPRGMIKLTGTLDDDEARDRLRKSWNDLYQNKHAIGILEQGTEWQQTSLPPQDAQFIATRKFQVAEIARIFRVPLHKLAEMDNATFSNIEEENRSFVQDTLLPWVVRWEQEINRKLFRSGSPFFFEFELDGLLRGNIQARFSAYQTGFGLGAFSTNDILKLENRNQIGPAGDQRFIPLNLGPLTLAGVAGGDEDRSAHAAARRKLIVTARQNVDKVFAGMFIDASNRCVKAEAAKLSRLFSGFERSRDKTKLGAELLKFYEGQSEKLIRTFSPVVSAYFEATSSVIFAEIGSTDLPESADEEKRKLSSFIAETWMLESHRSLDLVLASEDDHKLSRAITELSKRWAESRGCNNGDQIVQQIGNQIARSLYDHHGYRSELVVDGLCSLEGCKIHDGIVAEPGKAFEATGCYYGSEALGCRCMIISSTRRGEDG